MQGYKLTNPNGTIYGFFSDKDMANKAASRCLIQRGSILKMEEVELPAIQDSVYNFIDESGKEYDFEADSIEQLKIDVMDYAERFSMLTITLEGEALECGVDSQGNEIYIVRAL